MYTGRQAAVRCWQWHQYHAEGLNYERRLHFWKKIRQTWFLGLQVCAFKQGEKNPEKVVIRSVYLGRLQSLMSVWYHPLINWWDVLHPTTRNVKDRLKFSTEAKNEARSMIIHSAFKNLSRRAKHFLYCCTISQGFKNRSWRKGERTWSRRLIELFFTF